MIHVTEQVRGLILEMSGHPGVHVEGCWIPGQVLLQLIEAPESLQQVKLATNALGELLNQRRDSRLEELWTQVTSADHSRLPESTPPQSQSRFLWEPDEDRFSQRGQGEGSLFCPSAVSPGGGTKPLW